MEVLLGSCWFSQSFPSMNALQRTMESSEGENEGQTEPMTRSEALQHCTAYHAYLRLCLLEQKEDCNEHHRRFWKCFYDARNIEYKDEDLDLKLSTNGFIQLKDSLVKLWSDLRKRFD